MISEDFAGYAGLIDTAGPGSPTSVWVVLGSKRMRELGPRTDLVRRSSTGFQWGYIGSGPAQLAIAILADRLNDDEETMRLYQKFDAEVVVNLPHGQGWLLSLREIDDALNQIRSEFSSD